MSSNYRDELIQVAAVAVAAIQCLDRGTTDSPEYDEAILREVGAERCKQEVKWGAQAHTPMKWLTILHEETGEVARAILENK